MWLIFWIRRSEGGALGLEQAVLAPWVALEGSRSVSG